MPRSAFVGQASTQGKSSHRRQAWARASTMGVPAASPWLPGAGKRATYGQASMHLPHLMQRAEKSASPCAPGGRNRLFAGPCTA